MKRHLNNTKHKFYEDQETDINQILNQGTRVQRKVTKDDKDFRCSILAAFMKAGIPVNKIDEMRRDLEYIGKKSLEPSDDLKANHLSSILKAEVKLQCEELREKVISIFFDATPRPGGGTIFNLVARYIFVSDAGKVDVRQRLINVLFLEKSMDVDSMCKEVGASLHQRRLIHQDVKSISVHAEADRNADADADRDACSLNPHLRAIRMIEGQHNLNWFKNLCLSQLANDAGDCAEFVILSQVSSLLHKIFENPDNDIAQIEWQEITATPWKRYSYSDADADTRWYSEFEVMHDVYLKFAHLKPFLHRLIARRTSVAHAYRLYKMLSDDVKSQYIKIELAAFVGCLEPLHRFCREIGGDGQLVFLAGKKVDDLYLHYNGNGGRERELPTLSSVRPLIDQAVQYVQGNPEYAIRLATIVPPRLTLNQIQAANPRPTRQDAIDRVNAIAAFETVGAAMIDAGRRESDLNIKIEVQYATLLEEHRVQVDAAIAQAADNMIQYPPKTIEEWNDHVSKGVKPAIDYFFERMNKEGQGYHQIFQFYRCARIFDPTYAATIEYEDAKALIKGLRQYEPLNDDITISNMIDSFDQFQSKARRIPNPSSDIDFVQWHYDNCHANANGKLKAWFDACAKVALVQPSSGASARVVSLLKQQFRAGKQSYHALSDTMLLSLYLAYNERNVKEVIDIMHI